MKPLRFSQVPLNIRASGILSLPVEASSVIGVMERRWMVWRCSGMTASAVSARWISWVRRFRSIVSAIRMAMATVWKCEYRESRVASEGGESLSWSSRSIVRTSSGMLEAWGSGGGGARSMVISGSRS